MIDTTGEQLTMPKGDIPNTTGEPIEANVLERMNDNLADHPDEWWHYEWAEFFFDNGAMLDPTDDDATEDEIVTGYLRLRRCLQVMLIRGVINPKDVEVAMRQVQALE